MRTRKKLKSLKPKLKNNKIQELTENLEKVHRMLQQQQKIKPIN
jgi:hypothetical protein